MDSRTLKRKIMKVIAIFILTALLLLVYSYQNLSQLKIIQNPFEQCTEESTLDIIQKLNQNLTYAIEQLKFETKQGQKAKQCPRFFKFEQVTAQNQWEQQTKLNYQLCNQKIQRKPQIILITVMVPGHLNRQTIQTDAYKLQQNIYKGTGLQIKIQIEGSDNSILPQQLKDKIDREDYIGMITTQVKELKYLKHCRLSNKKCQNFILFLRQWPSLSDSYYEVGHIYFSKPQHYQQTILSIIFGSINSIEEWKRVTKIAELQQIKNQLTYMSELALRKFVSLNFEFAQQYIKQAQAYLRDGHPILSQPFRESASSLIDLFPSEYKLGIYLPLLLILVIFPCSNVLKI